MLRRLGLTILLLTSLASAPNPSAAEDWNQFRGPERDGKSTETGLLDKWPEGGPPLLLRASGLGNGYSSLAVVGEQIFTTGDLGEAQYVIAVARDDGRPLWKTEIGPGWDDQYLGARSTPTVSSTGAGDRVFALSTQGDLVSLEAGTGEERWRRRLAQDYGGDLMKAMNRVDWRYSESPLVDAGRVVVTPGAPDAALIAFDADSGAELWRARVPELGPRGRDGAAYASVVVSNAAGVKQYVQLLGRGVVGLEASSGRYLWGYNRVANDVANIATPLIDGDHVFVSTAYDTGSALLRIGKDKAGLSAQEVYFLPFNVLQNHHGGLILHEGHVYTGTGHKKGFPICVELATGEVVWGPIRNAGRGSASLAFADGHLYFRYEGGTMILVEATPEEYREKGSFTIPEVRQLSWSRPVISGGRLYLREQDNLFVYDIRERGPSGTAAGSR